MQLKKTKLAAVKKKPGSKLPIHFWGTTSLVELTDLYCRLPRSHLKQ
jgi:hypothetical protein